jgi:hypothetical protein
MYVVCLQLVDRTQLGWRREEKRGEDKRREERRGDEGRQGDLTRLDTIYTSRMRDQCLG